MITEIITLITISYFATGCSVNKEIKTTGSLVKSTFFSPDWETEDGDVWTSKDMYARVWYTDDGLGWYDENDTYWSIIVEDDDNVSINNKWIVGKGDDNDSVLINNLNTGEKWNILAKRRIFWNVTTGKKWIRKLDGMFWETVDLSDRMEYDKKKKVWIRTINGKNFKRTEEDNIPIPYKPWLLYNFYLYRQG